MSTHEVLGFESQSLALCLGWYPMTFHSDARNERYVLDRRSGRLPGMLSVCLGRRASVACEA